MTTRQQKEESSEKSAHHSECQDKTDKVGIVQVRSADDYPKKQDEKCELYYELNPLNCS